MKSTLIISTIFTTAIMALAAVAHAEDSDFAKRKQELLQVTDQRLNALQQNKTCVNNAADDAALKKCLETMRDAQKEMKHDAIEHRRDRLDRKMKKLEEKK